MKNIKLSDHAADELADVRLHLAKAQPIKFPKKPSYSVTVEFLTWWFEKTRGSSDVSMAEFSPTTRTGRPTKSLLISKDRPVSPSVIRKLAGVDRCGLPGKL